MCCALAGMELNHADWFPEDTTPHGSGLESSKNPSLDLFLR